MTPKVVNVKLAGTMLSVGPPLQFDPAKGLRRIEFRLDPASKLVWAEGNDHPNRHAFTVVQSNTKKDPLTAQPPIDGGKTLVVNNAHYDEGTAVTSSTPYAPPSPSRPAVSGTTTPASSTSPSRAVAACVPSTAP